MSQSESEDEGDLATSECPTASLPSVASTLHDLLASKAGDRPDVTLEIAAGESYPDLVTEDLAPPDAERTSAVAEASPASAESSTAVADKSSAATHFPGTIGVLSGNWGGNKHECQLQEHMSCDLKSGPCTCVLLQEATEEVLANLKAPGEPGILVEEGPPRGGGGKHSCKRLTFEYLGLRGRNRLDVLIACRVSHCESMQRSRHDRLFKKNYEQEW